MTMRIFIILGFAFLTSGCIEQFAKAPASTTDAVKQDAVSTNAPMPMLSDPWAAARNQYPVEGSSKERHVIKRLAYEIDALSTLIDEGERQANPSGHYRFRFDWLRRDLTLVRRGLEDYLSDPGGTERPMDPIRGDYR